MKTLLLLPALAFLTVGVIAQPPTQTTPQKAKRIRLPGEFHSKYDRFTDETRVVVGPYVVEDLSGRVPPDVHVKLAASLVYKGERLLEDVKIFLVVFSSTSKEWQFLQARDLYVLADGERFKYDNGARLSDIKIGGVDEMLGFEVPRKDLEKIAAAKKVEMRVGVFELALTPTHLAAFYDLLETGTRK